MHHNKDNLRTPLSVARGLGSAKSGFKAWWMMKITSAALIPLSLWFIYSLVSLKSASATEIALWLSSPFSAVTMVLFMLALFYHAALGIREVIEDYIHCHFVKLASLYVVNFAIFIMSVLVLFSVVKLHFSGI